MRSLSALLLLSATTAVGACSFNPGANTGLSGAGAGNAGTTGGQPGLPGRGGSFGSGRGGSSGSGTGGSSTPTEDANCGVTTNSVQKVPPDLLIVLDRSSSMEQQPDGTQCGRGCTTSKWAQMTAAIKQVVMQTETTVRWGLKYFANRSTCGITDGVAVPPDINNSMNISMSIDGTSPSGSTPTQVAIQSATTYMKSLTDTNPKYIMLATDGLPNCAPNAADYAMDDSAGAVMAVGDALAAGFPTFVVGIGMIPPGGNVDPMVTLRDLAMAGGRAPAAAPGYYQVNTTADLVSVLQTIQGMAGSCTFSLTTPPAPNNIAVHADGKTVPKDTGHTNGWDYNGGCTTTSPSCAVTLYGSWCDRVMSHDIQNVQALYGCPDGPPVP